MSMEDDRTTGSLSWIVQLQRYLALNSAGDAGHLAERRSLLEKLQASPCTAESWAGFLMNEEAILASGPSGRSSKANPVLAQLYQRAIELVPRSRGHASEEYMYLWVGHARHLW